MNDRFVLITGISRGIGDATALRSATGLLRGRLVARLGEIGFTVIFYLVASASFGIAHTPGAGGVGG